MNNESRFESKRGMTAAIVQHGRVERLTRNASEGGEPERAVRDNIVWSTFMPQPKEVTSYQK